MSSQQHHEHSPSKLEQMRLCPASNPMQKGIPDAHGEEWTEEGGLLHARVVTRDTTDLNDEQIETLNKCWRFFKGIFEKGDTVFYEEKVQIHDHEGNLLTEGTADVIILKLDGSMKIIDWKFGWIPVDNANKNIQLASYAVGAMQKYKKKECEVHVFQPRIRHQTKFTFTNENAIIKNIKKIITRSTMDTLVFMASEKACRYCKARLNCPAFRIKFQKLAASRNIYDLSNPDIVSKLYEVSKDIKVFIREIEDILKKIIARDGVCGKWKIQKKDGSRQIKKLNDLYDRLGVWLTPKEFNSVCSVTLGKLEKLCVEKIVAEAKSRGEEMSKEEARRQLYVVIGDLIIRGNPTKNIVEVA